MDYEITYSVPYDEPHPESEDLLPSSFSETISLSFFLALAITLDVPILTATASHEQWGRSTLGAGTSFHVGRSYSSRKIGYLDPGATMNGNLGGLGERFKSCGSFVSKRLCRKPQHDDDHRCLAPLVQELRILSHETLRDAQNLVRMLCIDWSGDSTDVVGGRCWPSLLLECATHGTLGQFLLRHPQLPWDLKWTLCLDIAEGLQVLHKHDIVHCDLKLDNILVFEHPDIKVVAKISDFGYSLITSDFNEQAVFPGRAGTPPWNAPEIAFGRGPHVHALGKADIYTMGLIVCTIILEGHMPWEAISASIFQSRKETNSDAAVFEVLAAALSEVIIQPEERVWEILTATVKSDPNDRCSAWDLLRLITQAFVEYISGLGETTPGEADAITTSEKVKVVLAAHGTNIPAMPLPNIFSADFEGVKFRPFTGVPDFEDNQIFKPHLLYIPALLEVSNDLSRRVNDRRGNNTRAVAEAEYQLCICHLEGYGVEKNIPRGLAYLAHAFQHGSLKARRAAQNFYDAFSHDFPADMASTEMADLLSAAIDETAAVDSLYNKFIATEALSRRYPDLFELWIGSNEFRNFRLRQFTYRIAIVAVTTDRLDLGGLFTGMSELSIGTPNPLCPETLSALHHAAALGDSSSVNPLLTTDIDVNAVTPHLGWTPLWMACAGGYFDVAGALLAHGADVRSRETSTGRGILHLLRAFRERAEVEYVVGKAQEAGLGIDEADSDGTTPLLETFSGWDLSGGAAARVLLESGADPFIRNNNGLHAFAACVAHLDPALLRVMLVCPAMGTISKEVVCEAMAAGLVALISQSPAFQIAWLGQRQETIIKDLLTQLLTAESTQCLLLQPHTRGVSPLALAVSLNRQTLAYWLMELRLLDVNLRGDTYPTALQWAIARNQGKLVEQLLEHGADPLITDEMGYNALHIAAVSMPAVMPTVANAIERRCCGGDPEAVKPWLNRKNVRGFTAFGLAVFEGSQEHLTSAEILRRTYQLEHDFWVDEFQETLLGGIVLLGAVADTVNLAQVKYLLGLRPKPRFVVSTDGSTLLHHAVVGWKNVGYSDGAVGYEILALLLKEFPGQEHIQARDENGSTAIMMAASCANYIAIRNIRDHAIAHHLSLDINIIDIGGETALDMVGRQALKFALGDKMGAEQSTTEAAQRPLSERAGNLDPGTSQLLAQNVRLTKVILSQMGAVSSKQLSGTTIWAMIASLTSITHERQVQFLSAMKQAYVGLDFDLPEVHPPQTPVGSYISLECSWRVTSFFLSIHSFSNLAHAKDHANERTRTGKRLLESWTSHHGTIPWEVTRYSSGDARPGRAWSVCELVELNQRVKRAWIEATAWESLEIVEYWVRWLDG